MSGNKHLIFINGCSRVAMCSKVIISWSWANQYYPSVHFHGWRRCRVQMEYSLFATRKEGFVPLNVLINHLDSSPFINGEASLDVLLLDSSQINLFARGEF